MGRTRRRIRRRRRERDCEGRRCVGVELSTVGHAHAIDDELVVAVAKLAAESVRRGVADGEDVDPGGK
eukprot:6193540-Pleurochrysis_carterae.AAC.1